MTKQTKTNNFSKKNIVWIKGNKPNSTDFLRRQQQKEKKELQHFLKSIRICAKIKINKRKCKNIPYLIKFNRELNKNEFENTKNLCLKDKSIGIGFNGYYDGLPMNNCSDETEIADHFENKRRFSIKFFDWFVNKMQIGDLIMLGKGRDKILYIAEIASPCYFTNETKYKGMNHRRRLTNIIKMDPIINIKFKNKKCKISHTIIKSGRLAAKNWGF